jgi:hypothetical protein
MHEGDYEHVYIHIFLRREYISTDVKN